MNFNTMKQLKSSEFMSIYKNNFIFQYVLFLAINSRMQFNIRQNAKDIYYSC